MTAAFGRGVQRAALRALAESRTGPSEIADCIARDVRSIALFIATLLVVGACGGAQPLTTVPFREPGVKETTVTLAPGRVRFASFVEATTPRGPVRAWYDIELLQGGAVVATTSCNPFTPFGRFCSYASRSEIHCHYNLTCAASVPAGGVTVVRVRYFVPDDPVNVGITRADLLVRQ